MTNEEKRKEKNREYQRKWREKNREYLNAKQREWNRNNPEKRKEMTAAWRAKNQEKYREYQRKYQQEWLENPLNSYAHKVKNILRGSIESYLIGGDSRVKACANILEITGTTPAKLMKHLSQYGDFCVLELDHIKPLRNATTESEIDALFHWRNIRLLPKWINASGRPTIH